MVVTAGKGDPDFVENSGVGLNVEIGESLVLKVTNPCPRCVMTTLPQADLPQDHGILRAAAQHNQPYVPTLGQAMPSVGVYASVGREGDGAVRASNDVDVSIVEGNQVELLRTQGPQSRTSGLTPRSRSNSSSHRKI